MIPKIVEGVIWADLTFSWFGSFHAFFTVLFSKLLHRKSVVVAGGYDVAKMPKMSYGLLNTKLWCLFSVLCFQLTDKILAVSQYTKREAIANLGLEERKIEVITHGFDKNRYHSDGEKENIVITVGRATYQTPVKGLLTFVKVSKLLADTAFYILGEGEKHAIEELKRINSCNLSCEGSIPQNELIKLMQRAKVYAQISAHESFGCALAEAMLCECIPVVTPCTAIPEVVGNAGYYVQYGDIEGTAEMIKRALRDGRAKGREARKRIEEKFSIEQREKKLIEVITRLQC